MMRNPAWRGRKPVRVSKCRRASVAVTIGVCVVMAGCASRQAPDTVRPVWRLAGGAGQMMAPHVRAEPARQEREVEDDGIEAQTAPRLRPDRVIKDDPSEPFSPNYGSAPIRTGDASDVIEDRSRHARSLGRVEGEVVGGEAPVRDRALVSPVSYRPGDGEGWIMRRQPR